MPEMEGPHAGVRAHLPALGHGRHSLGRLGIEGDQAVEKGVADLDALGLDEIERIDESRFGDR